MSIKSYINEINGLEQTDSEYFNSHNIPQLDLNKFVEPDQYFIQKRIRRNKFGMKITISSEEDQEEKLISSITEGDIVITSSLTNFSNSLASALNTVGWIVKKGGRVITTMEMFDSDDNIMGAQLVGNCPMIKAFEDNVNRARINRATNALDSEHIVSSSTNPYKIEDFKDFDRLYESYFYGNMTKTEFASKLNISRPTLDKLIKQKEDKTK